MPSECKYPISSGIWNLMDHKRPFLLILPSAYVASLLPAQNHPLSFSLHLPQQPSTAGGRHPCRPFHSKQDEPVGSVLSS